MKTLLTTLTLTTLLFSVNSFANGLGAFKRVSSDPSVRSFFSGKEVVNIERIFKRTIVYKEKDVALYIKTFKLSSDLCDLFVRHITVRKGFIGIPLYKLTREQRNQVTINRIVKVGDGKCELPDSPIKPNPIIQ